MELNLGIFPWDNNEKPFFVNELGNEFYIDKNIMDYASKKGIIDLPCWLVKHSSGEISRIIVNSKQEILREGNSLEDMGCFIDILALQRNGHANNL